MKRWSLPLLCSVGFCLGMASPGPRLSPEFPAAVIIHSATYVGRLTPDHAEFTVEYEIEAAAPGPMSVRLLSGAVAVRDFDTGSRAVRLQREDNAILARIEGGGRHRFTLRFSSAVTRKDELWSQLSFGIPSAVVSSVDLVAEGEDSRIELLSGTETATTHVEGISRARGLLGTASELALRWQTKATKTVLKPVVLCNVHHVLRCAPDVLKMHSRLVYEIPQGETAEFAAEMDPSLTVIRVSGDGLRDWSIESTNATQVCRVQLIKPVSGRYVLTVLSERAVPELPTRFRVPKVLAAHVERQGGSVVLSPSEVTLQVSHVEGLTRINTESFAAMGGWTPADLPESLQTAFRFALPSYECEVEIHAIQPEIKADYALRASITERRVWVKADVAIDIARAGIFAASFAVPPGFVVTEVRGKDIETWTRHEDRVNVSFSRKLLGRQNLTLDMEQTYDAPPNPLVLSAPFLDQAGEHHGYLGVNAVPGILVREAAAEGLQRVPVDSLPAGRGDETLGFRFREPGWSLTLNSEQVAARSIAEVFNLITIGDGFLGGSASIHYNVQNAGIQELGLLIPESWRNVEITGLDVRRSTQGEGGRWTVSLQDRILGAYTLVITYDQPFNPNSDTVKPFGLQTLGTAHESGYVVVTAGSNLEVSEAEGTENVRRIDARELPTRYLAMIENPILRAYSYGAHPYVIDLKTVRHPEQEPLDAIADRTRLVTVVTKPGRRETQATFLVKNNIKDSLRVDLPEGAELWTVFVNRKAVKPEIDKGRVVIPLLRRENRDRAYPVELMYVEQGKPISRFWRTSLALDGPKPDIHSAFVEWDLYLPRWVNAAASGGNIGPDRQSVYSLRAELDRAGKALDEIYMRHRGKLLFLTVLAALVWGIVCAVRTGRWRGTVMLLVLMLVGLVLVAMLLPAVSSARQRARRSRTMSNLSQLGKAITLYTMEHGGTYPDSWDELVGKYVGNEKILIDVASGERFDYYGAGIKSDDVSGDTPIAMSQGAEGGNVLFANGSVRWYSNEALQQQVLPNLHGAEMPEEEELDELLAAPASGAALTLGPDLAGDSGAMAAGLLPIRIELPKEGRVWHFSKVLDVGHEAPCIKVRLISRNRAVNTSILLSMVLLLGAFLAGRRGYATSSTLAGATAVCLLFLAAWTFFYSRELLFYLILGLPLVVACAAFVGIVRRSAASVAESRRRPPTPPEPPPLAAPDPEPETRDDRPQTGHPKAGPMLILLACGLLTCRVVMAGDAPCREADDIQPLQAQVVEAVYEGHVEGDVAVFSARLRIQVTQPNGEADAYAPMVLRMLGPTASVQHVKMAPRTARLVPCEDGFRLNLPEPGITRVDVDFITPVTGDAACKRLAFDVPPHVSGHVACLLDEREATVTAPGAVSMKTTFREGSTLVELLPGATRRVEIEWIPRVKRVQEEQVSAFADVATLLCLREGAMRLNSLFRYQVTRGEMLSSAIRIPVGLRLLRVEGDNVRSWELGEKDGERVLRVDMKAPVEASDVLWIYSELPLGELPADVGVVVPHALEVTREAGYLAITAEKEIGFTPANVMGIQQVDPGEFPVEVMRRVMEEDAASKANRPSTAPQPEQAYQYRDPAFSMDLSVRRLEPRMEVVLFEAITLAEALVTVDAVLDYDIQKAGVFDLRLALPAGYDLERVKGPFIKDWNIDALEGRPCVQIMFTEKIQGSYRLELGLLQRRSAFAPECIAPSIEPLNAAGVSGYLAMGAAFGIAFVDHTGSHVTEIPVSELPERSDAAVLAFRFREPGWTLRVVAETSSPWIQAEGAHVFHVGQGLTRVRTDFTYKIENAPVDRFALRIPDVAENVRVSGAKIRERHDNEGNVVVLLQDKVSGVYHVTVQYEVTTGSDLSSLELPFAQTEGTEREQGVVLVRSSPTVHVSEGERTQEILLPVDVRDVDDDVRKEARADARLAYRYLRRGQRLSLNLERYEPAEVLQANIEKAHLVTVLSESGQLMTQVLLTIRNNAKQNLQVVLPEESEVWSCFVAGEAAHVAVKDGALLLPLIQTEESEPSYDLELTYVTRKLPLKRGRSLRFGAPQVDLPMHNIAWEVYVPEGYTYGSFEGTMSHREEASGMFREFGIGEYQQEVSRKIMSQKRKAQTLLEGARKMAGEGDVISARRQYRRARQIDVRNTAIDQEMKELDRAEAYANVAVSQTEQTFDKAFQQGVTMKGLYAGRSVGSPSLSDSAPVVDRVKKEMEVAEEQAKKIRETQSVSASKVTPLRVSVPIRGVRYMCEQVLWVPGDAAVSIHMKARQVGRLGVMRTLALGGAAFFAVALFVSGWRKRSRERVLVATVLLGLLYTWFVYL